MKELIILLITVFYSFNVFSQKKEVTITDCGTFTESGKYLVSNNLLSTGAPCLQFKDTSNITIDCQNNQIFSEKTGLGAVIISKVNKFTLTRCKIKSNIAYNDSEEVIWSALRIIESSNGKIYGNEIRGFEVSRDPGGELFGPSTKLRVYKNKIYRGYQQANTSNSVIENNYCEAGINGIESVRGKNNIYRNNTINGNWDGKLDPATNTGLVADDGIVLADETNALVDKNIISNVYDCGIETARTVTNTRIQNNKISIFTNTICGIGAWYWSNWRNNKVIKNSIKGGVLPFLFFRYFRLEEGEEKIYFDNNLFSENSYSLATSSQFPGASSFYFNPEQINANSPDGRPVTDDDLVITNNVFKKNSLIVAPNFFPKSGLIDRGGNKCRDSNGADVECKY